MTEPQSTSEKSDRISKLPKWAQKIVELHEEESRHQQKRAAVMRALRWSNETEIRPDVPPPPHSSDMLSVGYTYNEHLLSGVCGSASRAVSTACSSSTSHCVGRTDKTSTQHPMRLYSTRLLAMRALRCKVELQFAIILAGIDAEIKQELEKNGDDNEAT